VGAGGRTQHPAPEPRGRGLQAGALLPAPCCRDRLYVVGGMGEKEDLSSGEVALPSAAVQCSAVQCSAVQCSAVQCSAEQCRSSVHPAMNGAK
jgi:hypothetical protein